LPAAHARASSPEDHSAEFENSKLAISEGGGRGESLDGKFVVQQDEEATLATREKDAKLASA
jgi:hypothetical protein